MKIKRVFHKLFADYFLLNMIMIVNLIHFGIMIVYTIWNRSDYRYFTREFRRQFGVTPEEYAKNAHRLPSMRQERHKSIHSVERICTAQESLKILRTK